MNEQSPAETIPAFVKHLSQAYGDQMLASGCGRTITYLQLEQESEELALGLLASGVGKGTRVGLLMGNSPDWIVTWIAALRVGALVVGISTFLKPPELAWVLKFADIDTLLFQEKYLRHNYLENMEQAIPSIVNVRDGKIFVPEAPYLRSAWIWSDQTKPWMRGNDHDLRSFGRTANGTSLELLTEIEQNITPADLAIVIFTSGSTATPKGVVHDHGTMVRHAMTMVDYGNCARGAQTLVLTPFFWVGGMLTTLLSSMAAGAGVICPDSPNPKHLLELLRLHRPEHISGWGGQLNAIKELPDFMPEDFELLQPAHNTQRRSGAVGPSMEVPLEQVPNSLGMSETFGPHSGELDGEILKPESANSFGRAISQIERKVIDPESGVELALGETGELAVRGSTLMQGYYKKERSETFDQDGYFRTGDRCAIADDGHLFYYGRWCEMIKTSGANVSPLEVELALMEFPDVAEAIVLGKPDSHAGEVVVGVVVPEAGQAIDASDLRGRLDRVLSSYKIPKQLVTHLQHEDLPRTDSGKVRKRQLLEMIMPMTSEPSATHRPAAESQATSSQRSNFHP